MKEKIAFFDTKPYDKIYFDRFNKQHNFEITYFETKLSQETALLARGFPVLCLFVHDKVDAQLATTLANMGVKHLALRSNGYNHIDLKSVYEKISVTRVPNYSPYAVAEHTITLMLTLNRKTHLAYWRTRMNNFNLNGLLGFDMHGKTAGVIGTGHIGAIVTRLLNAFGMRVFAFDVHKNKALEQEGVEYADLNTLYKNADIITFHCPLTPETKYMVNKDSIARMKDGVILVNTGRGKLIHTTDLIDGLKQKKIAGAALDVYEEEEKFFFEDLSGSFIEDDVLARLLTFPNVIITAHQGFFTQEALTQIAQTTLENINCFFKKLTLQNEARFQNT